jgi:hypothetical protein
MSDENGGVLQVCWHGKPVEMLTRDELLECVRWLAAGLQREQQWADTSAQTYDALLRARLGT